MNKLKIFSILIGLMFLLVYAFAKENEPPKKQKYYITFPFNYSIGDSLVVFAESRIEALVMTGVTVWNEFEWNYSKEWEKRIESKKDSTDKTN